MNKKIGFIGCGNMAKAIIGGIISASIVSSKDIIASARHIDSLEEISNKHSGIKTTQNNIEVVKYSDIIFLSVKPNIYQDVIQEIKDSVTEGKIIITIAPGKTLEDIKAMFGKEIKILRTMPNTPALVGEGVTAICGNENITDEDKAILKDILGTFSIVEEIEEKLFDAVVAVSGSSPAYVFVLIEAMADAAVMQGMPRAKAYKFAAQAVMGSAKMVLETKNHPGALKDMVCSPGGTTIEAVAKLEEKGFRSAVIEAMRVCGDKSSKM